MNQETIKTIVADTAQLLVGRSLGKIFQLSTLTLAVDFGLREGLYLLISVEPASPRFYLIKRRLRELEKESVPQLHFAQALRSNLSGGRLTAIAKDPIERVVRLSFDIEDETGLRHSRLLVAQLTGRSANLFLLDRESRITHALRPPKGAGQQVGETYRPPPSQANAGVDEEPLIRESHISLSAAADEYYSRLDSEAAFDARAKAALDHVGKEIRQRKKLKANLNKDLATHGDAEQHKRLGDLLLANIATAQREGAKVRIRDYFAEGEPQIELELEEHTSLQDEAGRLFTRYSKSKRAAAEIARRLTQLEQEMLELQGQQARLSEIQSARDEAALASFEGGSKTAGATRAQHGRKRDQAEKLPGVRRYRSSDGYEILVGRAARTNDQLTFRVARPHDLWLHAADYPGSHVIVRNLNRKQIPHRTVIEAAQLAAKFSQAGNDAKVNVNYAERKFLSKPKGAAPGLVRMSSFRSITVKPGENIERI